MKKVSRILLSLIAVSAFGQASSAALSLPPDEQSPPPGLSLPPEMTIGLNLPPDELDPPKTNTDITYDIPNGDDSVLRQTMPKTAMKPEDETIRELLPRVSSVSPRVIKQIAAKLTAQEVQALSVTAAALVSQSQGQVITVKDVVAQAKAVVVDTQSKVRPVEAALVTMAMIVGSSQTAMLAK